MSDVENQLPSDIKTQSLNIIGYWLNNYYQNMGLLIQYHYSGSQGKRDQMMIPAIESFYLVFTRLKSNIPITYSEDLKKIELILLQPDYDKPNKYFKELYKAYTRFNEIMKNSNLDNIVKSKPRFHGLYTHKHKQSFNYINGNSRR